MERKKKILCLILCVICFIAVCAPCALGVHADELGTVLIRQFQVLDCLYSGSSFSRIHVSNSGGILPLYGETTNQTNYFSYAFYSFSPSLQRSTLYTLVFTIPTQSFASGDLFYSINNTFAYSPDEYHSLSSFDNGDGSTSIVFKFDTLGSSVDVFYVFVPTSILASAIVSYEFYEGDYTPSVPDPPTDDSEYTPLEVQSYVANEKTLSDPDDWQDPTAYLWSHNNATDSSLPWEFIAMNRVLFLSFGAVGDYSEFFDPFTTISGQCQITVTDEKRYTSFGNQIVSSDVSYKIANGYVWLTNGFDPHDSSFQYYQVPFDDWHSRITLWQYPIDLYDTQFVFNFWFTIPPDVSSVIGFTPTAILCYFDPIVQVDQTSFSIGYPPRTLPYQYDFYTISYFHRISDSSPLPVQEFDKPDVVSGENGVDYGLDQEYDRTMNAYDPKVQAGLDVFNLTNLGNSFEILFNGLNYQGESFSFFLPATGQLPFLGVQLWDQQEIPIKDWIDRIPTPLIVIVRFTVWLGLAWGLFYSIRGLVRDISGGEGH